LGTGEVRGGGIHRQTRYGDGADVTDGEVDVADVSLFGHRCHSLDVAGIQQQTGKAC